MPAGAPPWPRAAQPACSCRQPGTPAPAAIPDPGCRPPAGTSPRSFGRQSPGEPRLRAGPRPWVDSTHATDDRDDLGRRPPRQRIGAPGRARRQQVWRRPEGDRPNLHSRPGGEADGIHARLASRRDKAAGPGRRGGDAGAGIAWETEVWFASDPDHLVHFNGEKFLGPLETDG